MHKRTCRLGAVGQWSGSRQYPASREIRHCCHFQSLDSDYA
jgi:hypothetical protein